MKENIEEAVEILKHIKEYMQENINNGTHKFIYNEQGFDEKCIDIINAINEILSDYKRVLKENEELKDKWDKDTHKLQNDLDIANAEKIEIQKENEELNKIKSLIEILKVNTMEDEKYIVISKGSFFDGSYKFLSDDYISKQKIKDILNEINKEYIKQEKIFNKHFEKENRDIQDYYIQKEATNIMQELSWIEGKLQDLL